MLELQNIRISLQRLDGTPECERRELLRAAAKRLGLTKSKIASFTTERRSIDARKTSSIQLVYTLLVKLKGANTEEDVLINPKRHITRCSDTCWTYPEPLGILPAYTPVIVGAGAAGLFCALTLSHAGLNPVVLEQGDDISRRCDAIAHHNATGELDPRSNIQFGLGGAGTFSDGKLNTGTKSPYHQRILKTFVDCGADRAILIDAKPHVGSDMLPEVIDKLVRQITELGGSVYTRVRMSSLDITNRTVRGLTVEITDPATGYCRSDYIKTNCIILATGHSARDVFEQLKCQKIALESKTFAMGLRIEHLQATINKACYGKYAGHPALGAASYRRSYHLKNGRCAFSFCMCPGGQVVSAASEANGVCTNGMSLSDRAGINANAGLLINVFPEDLPEQDILAGLDLQRSCEQRAYKLGGGAYKAPVQLVGDFLQGIFSRGAGSVMPTYPRDVTWTDVSDTLPVYISDGLKEAIPQIGRSLKGFDAPDAVLTGVETRSSSPIRILRDAYGESLNIKGLWPTGEGAGYAGGIMSAAADGIRTAESIIKTLTLKQDPKPS